MRKPIIIKEPTHYRRDKSAENEAYREYPKSSAVFNVTQ